MTNLRTLRDEARIQLHLAGMELQIRRLLLEQRLRRAVVHARARAAELGGALADLRARFVVR
jgi:hypothetical protein